ncbi:MAG: VCBS repeat-containing protein [Cyclobacteriaceae bacterium]
MPVPGYLILWSFFVFSLVVTACGPTTKEQDEPLLVLRSSDETGVSFANQLHESEALNIITFEYFYNGAGVGVGDLNNDGWQDLFFAANMEGNRLYLNRGEWQFEDVTPTAGIKSQGKWATGVAMIDINQDGWLDIYVCYAGPYADPKQRINELYINQQDGTFSEQAEAYGLADTGHSTQAAFLDYDRDGDLDMYLLTNITDQTGPNIIRNKRNDGRMVNTDRLYRNDGIGDQGHPVFTDVSAQAGITYEGYGLGVSVADINQDDWPDIYVSNDYLSNDLLYINNQDGTFTEKAGEYFQHQSYSAMGNDVADFNNDQRPDIITVDMLPPDNRRQKLMIGATNYNRYYSEQKAGYDPQFMRNTLQLHQGMDDEGNPHFSEIGQMAGVFATDWSWSALLVDLDNDGWRDLTVTNGYPRDITNRDFASYKMQEFQQAAYNQGMQQQFVEALNSLEGAYLPNFVFQNTGDMGLQDRSAEWGFRQSSYSTGAAYADLDNDGDLDYVTNNTNEPAFLYENQATEQLDHHYLSIQLAGTSPNVQGFGAKIWCYQSGQVQYTEHFPIRGFQSTVQSQVHFGLGDQKVIDSLVIRWPDGTRQTLYNPEADQPLVLYQKQATASNSLKADFPKKATTPPLFQKANSSYSVQYKHQEQHYNDFAVQPLLPHKYSQQGPGLAVGDVNGDGREDFFVGGAFRQSGQIFIQQTNATFRAYPIAVTDSIAFEEDHGALFFDVDQDDDLDLYVVSGGNEFREGSRYYQDRLYRNDGEGQLVLDTTALPKLTTPGSCVVAQDFDQDGDLDLFVGGRNTPQQFPLPGTSYLLENRDGVLVDVADEKAPGLSEIGMVTAALWTDVNSDGWVDLMLTGEWMEPTFFQNRKGKLEKSAIQFTDQDTTREVSGWWNSLQAGDFDQDGDIDYVAGNLGKNHPFKLTAKEPLQLFVADFNQDHIIDPILSMYSQPGATYPVHPRDDMVRQLNGLRNQFASYADYADATLKDVLTPDQQQEANILEANLMESCYFENLGDFRFAVHPLPTEAQMAPVFGIQVADYNQDTFPDLLLIGNSYATEVRTGRYDAFTGLCLLGDGKGNFTAIPSAESGFWMTGDAKAMTSLTLGDGSALVLTTQNNDSLVAYQLSQAAQARIIAWQPQEAYALITYSDGRVEKLERYQGSGYLSQSSSSSFRIPASGVTEVKVFTVQGSSRLLTDVAVSSRVK